MSAKAACLPTMMFVLVFASSTTADLLLTENWEAETVGDNIGQLDQWNSRDGTGSIMLESGTKFLRLDDPPGSFSWVTSKEAYSFSQGNEMALEAEITLRGSDNRARIGIRRSSDPTDRYLLDVLVGEIQLYALAGPDLLGSAEFSAGVDTTHTYILQMTHNGSDIDFSVFADGSFLFSAKDTTPFFEIPDLFNVQLTTANPMAADFDNITLDAVPEPTTFTLFTMSGLVGAFVAWRKRKRA